MAIIWLFCFIGFLFLPLDIWENNAANRDIVLTQSDDEKDKKNGDQKWHKRKAQEERKVGLMDSRISCLLFLTFSNVLLTEMSAFYVPVLRVDHLHLKVIHVKLILTMPSMLYPLGNSIVTKFSKTKNACGVYPRFFLRHRTRCI